MSSSPSRDRFKDLKKGKWGKKSNSQRRPELQFAHEQTASQRTACSKGLENKDNRQEGCSSFPQYNTASYLECLFFLPCIYLPVAFHSTSFSTRREKDPGTWAQRTLGLPFLSMCCVTVAVVNELTCLFWLLIYNCARKWQGPPYFEGRSSIGT